MAAMRMLRRDDMNVNLPSATARAYWVNPKRIQALSGNLPSTSTLLSGRTDSGIARQGTREFPSGCFIVDSVSSRASGHDGNHSSTKGPDMDSRQVSVAARTPIAGPSDVRRHIFDALRRKRECDLEELVLSCSSLTWNQVFLEIDRLSRTGEVRLVPRKAGVYAVRLPA
jgi:hypothetical protein